MTSMKTMIIGVEKKEEYNICEDCTLYNKDEIDRLSKKGKEWVEFADSIEIVDCRHDYACVFCGKERYAGNAPVQ